MGREVRKVNVVECYFRNMRYGKLLFIMIFVFLFFEFIMMKRVEILFIKVYIIRL